MITVSAHTLATMHLDLSPVGAVQAVRGRITSNDVDVRAGEGVALVNKLLGTSLMYADVVNGIDDKLVGDYELMFTQGVVEAVVRNVGVSFDEQAMLDDVRARISNLMSAPQHKWLFAKAKPATGQSTEQVAVAKDVALTVAVKADGSIKKGGKELLAVELYKLHVVNTATPVDNQGFIKILIKELGMTKSGASTYAYNMKKKFGTKATS